MTFTTKRAARWANCSKATIVRLIASKHLNGAKVGKRWAIVGTKEEIIAAVEANVSKHGWKRAKKSAQPSLPFGVVSDSVVPHVGRDAIPTSDLTFWLGLTQERRDLIRFLNGRLK